VYYKESMRREECHIAHAFEQTLRSMPRFGCSDCACASHLFFGPAEKIIRTATSLHMTLYILDANS
jgi:Uri superfamily endonuclease